MKLLHANLTLFTIGLVSMLGQVVIVRELSVAFYGVELIYILALGLWLFGSAAGAYTGRRRQRYHEYGHLIVFVLFAVSLFLAIFFLRGISIVFAGIKGTYLPFYAQLAGLFISIAPLAFLMGITFQWTAKKYVFSTATASAPSEGYSLAKAYAVECAGGMTGGLAATVFMATGMQNLTVSLLCAFICCIPGIITAKCKVFFALTAMIVLLTLFFSSSLNHWMTSWKHPELVLTKDTPYGRISVSKLYGQYSVFENNALYFETEGVGAEEFTHLPCLQLETVHDVLVLGGGIDGTVAEALKHHPSSITYTELNPALIDDILPILPEQLQMPFNDQRVKVKVTDPRVFLENTQKKFDVILIGAPEPDSAQTNRFYSKEFFSLCKSRLTEKGVLAFRLRAGDAIWTTELAKRNLSIVRALEMSFDSVALLPGVTMLVVAGNALENNADLFWARFQARKIESLIVSRQYLHYMYDKNRRADVQREMLNINAPVNSDSRPVCYRYAIKIWLSKFFPTLLSKQGAADISKKDHLNKDSAWQLRSEQDSALGISLLCILVAGASGMIFRILPPTTQDMWGMFLVSAAGTGLEGVLMLLYQVHNGVIYQDIGLLVMLFMTGMAAGAWAVEKLSALQRMFSRTAGMAFVTSFLLNISIAGIAAGFSGIRNALLIGLLLFWTGANVSAYFAYLSQLPHWQQDAKKAVSPLYASDLAGGGAATIAVSLFAVPGIGLAWTTAILAAVIVSLLFKEKQYGGFRSFSALCWIVTNI